MSLTSSSWPSGAQDTVFPFFFNFDGPGIGAGVAATDGGVDAVAGDPLLAFAISFSASWNGSIADGCATCSSFFGGAFLNVGSFGFGLGAEKKDESDLASLTAVTTGFAPSFFTVVAAGAARDEGPAPDDEIACFFSGGAAFGSVTFRFLLFGSG